jgi:hypothetical protein
VGIVLRICVAPALRERSRTTGPRGRCDASGFQNRGGTGGPQKRRAAAEFQNRGGTGGPQKRRDAPNRQEKGSSREPQRGRILRGPRQNPVIRSLRQERGAALRQGQLFSCRRPALPASRCRSA